MTVKCTCLRLFEIGASEISQEKHQQAFSRKQISLAIAKIYHSKVCPWRDGPLNDNSELRKYLKTLEHTICKYFIIIQKKRKKENNGLTIAICSIILN